MVKPAVTTHESNTAIPAALGGECKLSKGVPARHRRTSVNETWASTRAQYRRRVAELGEPERCTICGFKFDHDSSRAEAPHWDHNHETGKGRSWLCVSCNGGLGLLGDNPRLLRAAAAYLEKYGCSVTRSVLH